MSPNEQELLFGHIKRMYEYCQAQGKAHFLSEMMPALREVYPHVTIRIVENAINVMKRRGDIADDLPAIKVQTPVHPEGHPGGQRRRKASKVQKL